MALLDEITAFLAAEGLGTVNANIFAAKMPDWPHACCAVRKTGGTAPERGLGSTTPLWENVTIQVMFRGDPNDYDTPDGNAQSVHDLLFAIAVDQLLSGTKYHMVTPLQPPFPLGGQDKKERWRIACNYMIEKEPS